MIALGVQVDGYIGVAGHTHIVSPGNEPVTGPIADVVCAAHIAGDVVQRLLVPGRDSHELVTVTASSP